MPTWIRKIPDGGCGANNQESATFSGLLDETIGTTPGTMVYRDSTGWVLHTPSDCLDTIDATQGDVLYRGASGWACLAPATANYLLKTGGAAANPAWASLTSLLDSLASTRNMVLYRNATAWTGLAVGTAGNVIRYNGASADISWSRGSITGIMAVAGLASQTGGALGSFTPPELGPVIVTRALLYMTAKSNGAATVDIGIAANGSTSSDTLFDGLDVGTSVICADNLVAANAGTNGKPSGVLTAGQYITATGKADTTGLLGTLFFEYTKV